MEMLDIANFGHAPGSGSGSASGSTTRPVDHWRNGGRGMRQNQQRRRRAGSTDVRYRGSIYMEPPDAEHAARVLDEAPPTDLEDALDFESDADVDAERRSTRSMSVGMARAGSPAASSTMTRQQQYPGLSVATDGGTSSSSNTGQGPRSRSGSAHHQPSRIPTPSVSRQLSDPPRTPTPTQTRRTEPESPPRAAAPARIKARQDSNNNNTPPSPPRAPQPPPPQTPKKRAKSPAAVARSPSAKKARSRQPPVSQARANRSEKRLSVGEYPVPPDEDMMADAIPTWTQPVSPGGNWDEVRALSKHVI